MRRDTIFRIASMTKPVTATAVMMLVEGRLKIESAHEQTDRSALLTVVARDFAPDRSRLLSAWLRDAPDTQCPPRGQAARTRLGNDLSDR